MINPVPCPPKRKEIKKMIHKMTLKMDSEL